MSKKLADITDKIGELHVTEGCQSETVKRILYVTTDILDKNNPCYISAYGSIPELFKKVAPAIMDGSISPGMSVLLKEYYSAWLLWDASFSKKKC